MISMQNITTGLLMTDPPRKGVKLIMLHLSFFYHKYKRTKYHIYQSFSSCIDLIFTNQPNLVTDSGVHPWLHSNCHHQIVYAKFNFKIIYPPPYVRHIWHYNHEKSESIRKVLEFYTGKEFSAVKLLTKEFLFWSIPLLILWAIVFPMKQ